ncbi:MAG: hypothetical protein ACRERT_15305, partial [Pseudomonas sp.]
RRTGRALALFLKSNTHAFSYPDSRHLTFFQDVWEYDDCRRCRRFLRYLHGHLADAALAVNCRS